ncbi:hypothetical protein BVI2075_630009 [Burkholderia vietnamiensis]|nr:hypothetical protein BVI2075_630009 [Burkholderia vietnamiensis]
MQLKARFVRTALMSGKAVPGGSFFEQAQATKESPMMMAYRFMNQSERAIVFEARMKATSDAYGCWATILSHLFHTYHRRRECGIANAPPGASQSNPSIVVPRPRAEFTHCHEAIHLRPIQRNRLPRFERLSSPQHDRPYQQPRPTLNRTQAPHLSHPSISTSHTDKTSAPRPPLTRS